MPADFRDYVRSFPEKTQAALREMRTIVKKAAPEAEETISYDLPAFALHGKSILWFGGFKSHVGFYPGVAAIRAFANELAGYKTGRGSVQFPLDRPLPSALIDRIVQFKVRESR